MAESSFPARGWGSQVCGVGVFRVPGELDIQGQILSFQAVLGSAGSTGHQPFGGVGRGDGMFMALAEVVCLLDFLREGN